MNRIDIAGGSAGAGTTIGLYDAEEFVRCVEENWDKNPDKQHPELIAIQRAEWTALFEWCSRQGLDS